MDERHVIRVGQLLLCVLALIAFIVLCVFNLMQEQARATVAVAEQWRGFDAFATGQTDSAWRELAMTTRDAHGPLISVPIGNEGMTAIKLRTTEAYNDPIELIVGLDAELTITRVMILRQNETPGYGARIGDATDAWMQALQGRVREELRLVQGSESEDDSPAQSEHGIDAMSGATITSRAIVRAVRRAVDEIARQQQALPQTGQL